MNTSHRIAIASALLAASAPAWVHHSGAMFDAAKEQTLVGTITEFNWVNPHSSFKVNVNDVVWAIEMNAPQNLVRQGWKRTTLKAGDAVTVVVHPLRDGKPGGSFVSITLADGTKLGGSGPGGNDSARAASSP